VTAASRPHPPNPNYRLVMLTAQLWQLRDSRYVGVEPDRRRGARREGGVIVCAVCSARTHALPTSTLPTDTPDSGTFKIQLANSQKPSTSSTSTSARSPSCSGRRRKRDRRSASHESSRRDCGVEGGRAFCSMLPAPPSSTVPTTPSIHTARPRVRRLASLRIRTRTRAISSQIWQSKSPSLHTRLPFSVSVPLSLVVEPTRPFHHTLHSHRSWVSVSYIDRRHVHGCQLCLLRWDWVRGG